MLLQPLERCSYDVGEESRDGVGGYGCFGKQPISRLCRVSILLVLGGTRLMGCSTDMTEKQRQDGLKAMEDQTVLGRVSEPDEQAGIVVFYLSDKATCELEFK
jgi:hypothetical protein